MLSVNTNSNAMTALEYLNQTQGQLAANRKRDQHRPEGVVGEGQWRGLRHRPEHARRRGGLFAVGESLSNGTSMVDVAMSAGQSISDLLIQMKQQALSASDSSLDTQPSGDERQLPALLQQITTVVQNAQFNGTNLIDGSTTQITALASADGQHRITVAAENMSLGGSIVTVASTGSIRPRPRLRRWFRPSRPRSPMSTRLWPNSAAVRRSSRSRRPS